MSVDTTAPAKVNIASNEMRYTLVPRLSHFLSVKDWSRLLQACNILRQIMNDHTTIQYTLDDCQISLYRWGTADGHVPRLYISLPNLNVSRSYGWKGGTTGETFWHKIRFDPRTMMVHTGDYTFARLGAHRKRHGNNCQRLVPDLGVMAPTQHVKVGEYTPYATCFDCSAPHSKRAHSTVDLRGTSLAVASNFKHAGWKSAGTWEFSHDRQVVKLSGGGYCGWTASVDFPGNPDDHPGKWALKLKVLEAIPAADPD